MEKRRTTSRDDDQIELQKKRKLDAAAEVVADAVGFIVPRKVEGEQTSRSLQTYLIQEEASVVVASSPPLPYAAGPGIAPADCGPT